MLGATGIAVGLLIGLLEKVNRADAVSESDSGGLGHNSKKRSKLNTVCLLRCSTVVGLEGPTLPEGSFADGHELLLHPHLAGRALGYPLTLRCWGAKWDRDGTKFPFPSPLHSKE
jgi:hypothetical protein